MSGRLDRVFGEVFAQARRIADAVLYEGYVLYPYRASARKNHVRWQFGVLAPRDWCEGGGCESAWSQTEILVEPDGAARLIGRVRALQPQRRTVLDRCNRPIDRLEVGGEMWMSWDEGVDREVDLAVELTPGPETWQPFVFPACREEEPIRSRGGEVVGTFLRERAQVDGEIHVAVTSVVAASPLLRVRLRVENVTEDPPPGASRDDALRFSLVGAHSLLAVENGEFISMIDGPEWARAAVDGCKNLRTWPVLVGPEPERRVMLSSPIILADRPEIAPESPGDLYDATEIDEILTLRTMTLTEEEKREARATDPRAAAIIDRADSMPAEMMEKLHGAIRSVTPSPHGAPAELPFWDPGADATVSPDTDSVDVGGVAVAKGSRVRLRPGSGQRRTDAQDMFLVGLEATVQGVFLDVENNRYVAVTLKDDPGEDLHIQHGRFLYFYPDEIEPLEKRA